jgi:heptosyltransferase-2
MSFGACLLAERNPLPRDLVIRFGALGDLCLLAWSLARRGDPAAAATPDATLVTKAAFANLMAQAPGVTEVVPLPGPRLRDLYGLAKRLRRHRFAHVIDAHNNLRSHLLLAFLGRRPARRLAKDTGARLSLLLCRRRPAKLRRTMQDRFDALFATRAHGGPGRGGRAAGPSRLGPPPLVHLAVNPAAESAESSPVLGVAPGARWPSKRWPASHCATLLRSFRTISDARIELFLGPQEESWYDGSILARTAQETPNLRTWRNRDLVSVAAGLAGCSTVVTNDSGLLHLAEAVGTPVLALFGPTVREFGYYPSLVSSRVIERDLDCRPCSRNGQRTCWRQDQACLAEISPARVLETLFAMPPWTGRPEGKGRDA